MSNTLNIIVDDGSDTINVTIDGGLTVSQSTSMPYTSTFTIADDDADSFTPVDAVAVPYYSGLMFLTSSDATLASVINFGAIAVPYCDGMVLGTSIETTTGVLTGVVGTNGMFTVSANSDGKIYLENRTGAAVTVRCNIVQGT